MIKVIYTLALFSVFLSCKSSKNTVKDEKPVQQEVNYEELFREDITWQLRSYKGQAPSEAGFVKKIPIMIINKQEGRVGGHSGCNSFGGDVRFIKNTMIISKVISTKMYCQGVPETEFFNFLQQELVYRVENNTLILSGNGIDVMKFEIKVE